jgi:2-polyprenyl-3-methyl-5-hydroxy-6-metoxy-1,4-benzoquinol methylase
MARAKLVIPAGIPEERVPPLLKWWYQGSRARRHLYVRRVSEVLELVGAAPRGRVLDVGCGWGLTLFSLEREGFTPFGVDLVQDDFYVARRIAAANDLGCRLVRANASALPFRSRTFVAVTAVETFEHIYEEDREKAVKEVAGVLRPGGTFVLSTPNYWSLVERVKRLAVRFPVLRRMLPYTHLPRGDTGRDEYHPWRYHKPIRVQRLKALLEAVGFTVLATRSILFTYKYCPDRLFPLARIIESFLERLPLIRNLASTMLVCARRGEG